MRQWKPYYFNEEKSSRTLHLYGCCTHSEKIHDELHSGATIYESMGAYDHQVHKEIIAIVDNQEYKRLMDYMKKTDPKAFITVYSVSEIRYQPKLTDDGKSAGKK